MGETIGEESTASKAKPTILVPPRGLLFANGSGPGFSPGPMTLVSNLFPEQGPFSFSQLLAGAMSSPLPSAAQPHPRPESFDPLFMVPPGLNPTGFLNSPGYLSPLQSPFGMSHQQALAHVTAQAALTQSFKQMQAEFHHSSSNHPMTNNSPDTLTQNPTTNSLPTVPDLSKADPISEIPQSDKIPGDKPANDGYNWRKYGQKNVKASECPRSYYKCSSLSCPVKKKVGRALDGSVSEVTYKGDHNHDLPQHKKRGKDSCASDTRNMASQGRIEADALKEAISSNNNDKDSAAIPVDKGDEDEPFAKKRSLDIGPSVLASSHHAVSDPKIVLQTRSEVDLLDDGYKWRKYGQKLVKGNLHPRSYYRCTYAGCNVRKHVERASVDPKAVITTYEGKHNHDIPTGRHAGVQQLKTQKKPVSKNPPVNEEIDYRDDKDNTIPISLQLKEG